MSDLIPNPEARFSHDEAHIEYAFSFLFILPSRLCVLISVSTRKYVYVVVLLFSPLFIHRLMARYSQTCAKQPYKTIHIFDFSDSHLRIAE